MRCELTDYEWAAIKPMLPNKPRGVPRVNDRRVLNGIFWVLRSGAPWRDQPGNYGPYTTCYNRFVRWRRAGIWSRIMETLVTAHDEAVQMIDTSIVRVHQHAACIARNKKQSMGRSRGGLTSKIHAVVDTNGLPVRLGLTAGEAHDNQLLAARRNKWRYGRRTRSRSCATQKSRWHKQGRRRKQTEVDKVWRIQGCAACAPCDDPPRTGTLSYLLAHHFDPGRNFFLISNYLALNREPRNKSSSHRAYPTTAAFKYFTPMLGGNRARRDSREQLHDGRNDWNGGRAERRPLRLCYSGNSQDLRQRRVAHDRAVALAIVDPTTRRVIAVIDPRVNN